jgi:hypothetical protein
MRIAAATVLFLLAAPLHAQDRLPAGAAAAAFKQAKCTVAFNDALAKAEPFDLEAGKTLYKVECWRMAYQTGSILLLDDGAGPVRPLTFQGWNGKKFEPELTLSDVDYVPQSKTLTSYRKGSAEADCGTIGVWRWTGADFKMTGYWYKAKCDGYPFSGQPRYRIH